MCGSMNKRDESWCAVEVVGGETLGRSEGIVGWECEWE